MEITRRKLLKLAGLGAVGLTAGRYTKIFAKESLDKIITAGTETVTRWAMVVDLRKCLVKENCRNCIDACHKMHNVPDLGSTKHEIKWIWKEDYEHVFIDQENHYLSSKLKNKNVPIFCNHCDNPPCVRVCPTQATWKRDDGIVMMDWHRCIGCRYCIVACPYGSRSFNWVEPRPYIKEINAEFPTRTKGVVEKCTFCEKRLTEGLPPACVEACKEKALIFGNLNDPDSEVRQILKENFSIRRKPGLGTKPEIYYIVT